MWRSATDIPRPQPLGAASGPTPHSPSCGRPHLMPEICMSGSMSRMWKRSHGLAHRTPRTERGGNSDAQTYRHRATSGLCRLRLYTDSDWDRHC